MPKNAPTPKQSSAAKARARAMQVAITAQQVDRRRQAQIVNQIGSINRLLAQFDEHQCGSLHIVDDNVVIDPRQPSSFSSMPSSKVVYTEEMKTLHLAYAETEARRHEAVQALQTFIKVLGDMVDDGWVLDRAQLDDAIIGAAAVIEAQAG